MDITCADPESFARVGPTLTTFFSIDTSRRRRLRQPPKGVVEVSIDCKHFLFP